MDIIKLNVNGVDYNVTPVPPVPTLPPPPPPPPVLLAPVIPATAISSGVLDNAPNWLMEHDPKTPGTSAGNSAFVSAAMGRNFKFNATNKGGERYHLGFASDLQSTHFCYDVEVYFDDPSQIQNFELDMNQNTADKKTCLYCVQAASGSGTWEYTLSTGWKPSNIKTDPRKWAAKTWHHIRIFSHRDAVGNVFYDGVEFNGAYTAFDKTATGLGTRALGWPKVGGLLLNFQIEVTGASDTVNCYARNLAIIRW